MTSVRERVGKDGFGGGARASRMRVWRWPVLLALLSVFGLLSALLGQGGIWWALSWVALSIPLVVIGRCLWTGSARAISRRSPS